MKKINNYKILFISIGAIAILICLIICINLDKNENEQFSIEYQNEEKQEIQENNEIEEIEYIMVHVAGEVANPGLYKFVKNTRIQDAINEAGGITENADMTNINFAYCLSDGQKLYIPSKNDKNNNVISHENSANIVQGEGTNNIKININTATQSELESIDGIGPSLASKIILHRQKNGKFKKIEDLKNVSGIGESKYEKLKEQICT